MHGAVTSCGDNATSEPLLRVLPEALKGNHSLQKSAHGTLLGAPFSFITHMLMKRQCSINTLSIILPRADLFSSFFGCLLRFRKASAKPLTANFLAVSPFLQQRFSFLNYMFTKEWALLVLSCTFKSLSSYPHLSLTETLKLSIRLYGVWP